jgi:hypothetical protein
MRVCAISDLSGGSDDRLPSGLYEDVLTLDAAGTFANAQERVFAYRGGKHVAKVEAALKLADMHATRLVDWDNSVERTNFLSEWVAAAERAEV